jgi:hypothetical protein
MASRSLHPLARQALLASGDPACYGWAFGLTKYLADESPAGCVEWAFDFIQPYLSESGEHSEVLTRGIQFLQHVLAEPAAVDLRELEAFPWEAWDHRTVTRGGRPLARLIWAATGVVALAQPGRVAEMHASRILPTGKNCGEIAYGRVWEQSAMAIQMVADDHPEVPKKLAEAFTRRVCFSDRPSDCQVQGRFDWSCEESVYEVVVLRASDAFYFEFIDHQGEGPLYSGPFCTETDMEKHKELLRHRPKRVHMGRRQE